MTKLAAAIYTRVSSPGQATADAASLEMQEAAARKLCESRGLEVVEHYQDAGKSATRDALDNRPAMQKLLKDAAAGRFTYLACYAEDRLSRNMEASGAIASILKLAGVRVLTEKGEIDFARRTDKLVYYVKGYASEEEADRIRERCDDNKRQYAKEGNFCMWQAPFGYAWVEGNLRRGIPNRVEPVAEELPTARLVFGLAAERRWSARKITAYLNGQRIHTRSGGRWYPGDVAEMLADERYCGRWPGWKNTTREGQQEAYYVRADLVPEPAVSERVWRRIQKLRAHHKKRTRRKMLHSFLLNGVLFCHECGSEMVGHQISDTPLLRYYVCAAKKANEGRPCRSRYVPAGPLEAEAWGLVLELRDHPEAAAEYAAATREDTLPQDREELERLGRALEGLGPKLDRFIRMRADEEITAEELRERRCEIEQDRQAWEQRAAELEAKVADQEAGVRAAEAVAGKIGGLADRLDTLPLEERRWLLRDLSFRMDLACENWPARSQERKYQVEIRWAGQDLVDEMATGDYAGSSKARAMKTAIWSRVQGYSGWYLPSG